ncbi:hypothetical protein LCGC14_1030420, partial [marine sediment metagenome]
SLTVRKVKYAPPPDPLPDPPPVWPVEGEYEWDGDAFEAFAYFGNEIKDYIDSFTEVTSEFPTLETTFLQAFRQQGVWIVELPGVGGGGPQQFRFKFDNFAGNFMVCVPWDSTTSVEGPETSVLRPYELRSTTSHLQTIDGIFYQWSGTTERLARRLADDVSEVQVINPPYYVDGIIYAARPIGGLAEGQWLNVDEPRAWARKFVQP